MLGGPYSGSRFWRFYSTCRARHPEEAGSIQGKVTDSSGAPIFGAVVTVQDEGGTSTTVTDMEGAFQISRLRPGNFNVKISASGMSDWTAESVAASTADTKPFAGCDATGADGDERDDRAIARRFSEGTG